MIFSSRNFFQKTNEHIYHLTTCFRSFFGRNRKLQKIFQADVSSKKRTNKFFFTPCRLVFVHFLEESGDIKNISKLTDLYWWLSRNSPMWKGKFNEKWHLFQYKISINWQMLFCFENCSEKKCSFLHQPFRDFTK